MKKLVFLGLLEKDKKGKRGARAKYRTTNIAHEYEANSFFKRVRETSQKQGWIIKEKDSFLIYGIPPENELSPLENEMLGQILNRIYGAFFDLYLLKQSIIARKEVNQPIDHILAESYLFEEAADLFKQQLQSELYRVRSENEIADLISFAKSRGIDIANPNRFLEIEKKWKSSNGTLPIYDRKFSLGGSFEEVCLAVLVMLSPDEIAEYVLDSYNYLKNLIEKLEE